MTGGYDSGGGQKRSTDIFEEGTTRWGTAGNLPYVRYGIRGVSFNNRIIISGTYSF